MKNKYEQSIAIFWGASFFLGILTAILTTINGQNWIVSTLVGICIFLVVGLTIQGIITLIKNENI